MEKKPRLNVVIPVYNEEKDLESSIRTLRSYLIQNLTDFEWDITIVDNASSDQTLTIAERLSATHPSQISVIHLNKKGRGRAVKYAWEQSTHEYLAYMDIDLSTDLKHFPNLVRALLRGYDISIGSRNAHGARVQGRNGLRTITSKGYIFLIKFFFWVHFSDAQCGFKAVTRRVVDALIPHVTDDEWFFDTELLLLAEKSGYRIYEEPVTWIDNPGSTVRVWKTAQGDLRGLLRMFTTRPWKNIYAKRGHKDS
ncbi:MAG: glycosyltransferase family 2 protein [bacterium]|nr:glycosyltransferase family 2 protein [bacterium]